MATKKKKVEPVEEITPVEVVPQILPDELEPIDSLAEPVEVMPIFEDETPPPPPAKPEPLLTVRVTEDFKDGALAARFAALGYPLLWKAGETREIPMGLFIRCKRSGARFEL